MATLEGETERFCPEIIRKHLQMWTELWNDVEFALAKKHHAQKIGHLMLDGEREEKCIQLCLNKSKRCMNKKQKENVFACFFSYNNNAIAWTSFDLKDIIYLQAIWKVHEGLSSPMKIEFISKNVGGDTLKFSLH